MNVMFSQRSVVIDPVLMPDNAVCVDRSGYVPTNVQVDRILRSSKIAATIQRLKNPNGSEGFIYEDMSQIELNYKDDLTMLAFAKNVKNRLEAAKASSVEQSLPVDKELPLSKDVQAEPSAVSESIEN